jgi:hypothetical protein
MGIPVADFSGPEADSGKDKEVLTVVGFKGDFVKKPKRCSLPRSLSATAGAAFLLFIYFNEANQLELLAAHPRRPLKFIYTA